MIKRTRSGYPRLAPSDDPVQLEAYFGLEHSTDKEQDALQGYRDPDAQAAFLLAVRCIAHLGYMPDLEAVPEIIRTYVAKQLSTELPVNYFRDRPARRTEILAAARAALDVQKWSGKRQDELKEVLLALALDYPREADLVGAAVDRLREWRIELPVEETIVTLAESALHQVERDTYEEVMRRADERVMAAIEWLLTNPGDEGTLLEAVKRPAGRAGVGSMGREADKLAELASLGIPDDLLASLGQRKISFLAEQASRYTAADLRSLSDQRRALILIAFVIRRRQVGRDTMLEQMEKILRRMDRDSEKGEVAAVLKREKATPFNRRLSTRILAIIATAEQGTVEEKLFEFMPQTEYKRIYEAVTSEEEDFAKRTARTSLLRRFEGHYRKMLPLLLTHVPFQAESPDGKEIVETLEILKQHLHKRTQQLTLRKRPRFLDSAWDDVTVVGPGGKEAQSAGAAPESFTAARRPLELQAILAVQGALKSGTVWVEGSERYSNLTNTLVPWDEPQRITFYEKHKFPATARDFTAKLTSLMYEALSDLKRRSSAGDQSRSQASSGPSPDSRRNRSRSTSGCSKRRSSSSWATRKSQRFWPTAMLPWACRPASSITLTRRPGLPRTNAVTSSQPCSATGPTSVRSRWPTQLQTLRPAPSCTRSAGTITLKTSGRGLSSATTTSTGAGWPATGETGRP